MTQELTMTREEKALIYFKDLRARKFKELINNYKGCDMWDTANGMQLALECLEENANGDSD